ncbi:MAG: hypothetical protein ACLFPD_01185 [Desulfosudaceae bacterium]
MDKTTRKRRLEKLIEVLKSWKGPRPDYENTDYSRYHQTEEEYQEEQRQWLESRRRKKEQRRRSSLPPEDKGD